MAGAIAAKQFELAVKLRLRKYLRFTVFWLSGRTDAVGSDLPLLTHGRVLEPGKRGPAIATRQLLEYVGVTAYT